MSGRPFTVAVAALTVIIGFVLSAHAAPSLRTKEISAAVSSLFDSWMKKHSMVFTGAEKSKRLSIFASNWAFVQQYNARRRSYTVGLNNFAHLTFDEFRAQYLTYRPADRPSTRGGLEKANTSKTTINSRWRRAISKAASAFARTKSFDWRDHGAVTRVKNQGGCGSCWAFSAIGAVESVNFLKTGALLNLSEQQLVDCIPEYSGCAGGNQVGAMAYIIKNGGVTSNQAYPYVSGLTLKNGTCKTTSNDASISAFGFVMQREKALAVAVSQQPVSVAIEVDPSFQLYTGGVYDGPCGTNANHAVLLVGFTEDTDKDPASWIVKNSWGPLWGELGYIRMKRNLQGTNAGICGITLYATVPIIL